MNAKNKELKKMNSLILKSLKIDLSKNQSARLFDETTSSSNIDGMKSSEIVEYLMEEFENNWTSKSEVSDEQQSKKALVGSFFEFVIGECLLRKGINPIYYQAILQHARISKFDWLLFHRETPVLISCKKSLAERWKQTVFEARDLKRIYVGGKCYMITYEITKSNAVINMLRDAPNSIDNFISAITPEFDLLLDELSQIEFCEAAVPESPIYREKLCQL